MFYRHNPCTCDSCPVHGSSSLRYNPVIADDEFGGFNHKKTLARKLYQQGMSMHQIARRINIGVHTLRNWLTQGPLGSIPDPINRRQEARILYQEGVSVREIARQLGVSWMKVKKWVSDLSTSQDNTHVYDRMQQARSLYQEGISVREIAHQLATAQQTIIKWVADLV